MTYLLTYSLSPCLHHPANFIVEFLYFSVFLAVTNTYLYKLSLRKIPKFHLILEKAQFLQILQIYKPGNYIKLRSVCFLSAIKKRCKGADYFKIDIKSYQTL